MNGDAENSGAPAEQRENGSPPSRQKGAKYGFGITSAQALLGAASAKDRLRTQIRHTMRPTNDPRQQPLLTPEQLRVIRQSLQSDRKASQVQRKATPREQFENLFR